MSPNVVVNRAELTRLHEIESIWKEIKECHLDEYSSEDDVIKIVERYIDE